MRKAILFLVLVSFTSYLFGQSNYEQFKKLLKENDTAAVKTLLTKWEKSNPDDPELYTSAFNYYFVISKQEIVSLHQEDPGKESLRVTDSTGKEIGFMYSEIGYNPVVLRKAFDYANKGIDKFPNRLDIRFGKCHVFGKIGDYESFTREIIKTVQYSALLKHQWLWTENEKIEDGEAFMAGTIQEYLGQLYDTEDDKLLENMKQIGDTTIAYFPNSVEVLSTTAVAYMLTNTHDKALGYLKRAEKINPKDYIVLNNIAHCYKLKGDKVNAIKYYELTEKYGDEQAKQQAKENIKMLKQ